MFQLTNNDTGSAVARIGQPFNNIIENYCQRVRDDLRSIESSNIAFALEYNQLFEAKCKLEKEVEIYHDRVKQLSLASSRQLEIINRLENIIMECAPQLPQEEQFKLSAAVYAAKQFDTDQFVQVSARDRKLESIDEIEEPNDHLAGSNSLGDQQSTLNASQQQAAVMNAIQLLQILSSQVRKKQTKKQRPATTERVDPDESATSTQKNIAATGASSQPSQVSASQVPAQRNLKQTSIYNYLGKSE